MKVANRMLSAKCAAAVCGKEIAMFSKFMDAMFGCRHSRYSFPMTARAGARRNQAAARLGTYVVCLDCGKEFAYDWQEMRVVNGRSQTASRSLVTKEAA